MRYSTLLALPLSLLLAGSALAQTAPQPAAETAPTSLSVGRLENVKIVAPEGTPKAMVVYFSNNTGWAPSDDKLVEALRASGDVVLGVDMKNYAAVLDKDDGACLYVVGEITDLAQTAQRELGIQTYLPPILVGTGEGATFAYAALADAPVNTLGGAVAAGFDNRLTLKLPFCPGSTATKTADGKAFTYAFDNAVPEPGTLLVRPDQFEAVTEQASAQPGLTVQTFDADSLETQVTTTVAAMATTIEPFGNLPAVDLPAKGKPRAVAILISGDGGWRDIDKSIGDWLSTQNVHVVGLDSLHYFWSKRTPEELSTDMTALIKDADPTGQLPVMLIGYSFGADVIPFAWPLLPKPLQDRTKVLALMAPSQSTSFQVTVTGWLGIDDSGYDIAPAIAKLPTDRVLCLYGEDDDESSCTDPLLKNVKVVKTVGGHHFDGDYTSLAKQFLDYL